MVGNKNEGLYKENHEVSDMIVNGKFGYTQNHNLGKVIPVLVKFWSKNRGPRAQARSLSECCIQCQGTVTQES